MLGSRLRSMKKVRQSQDLPCRSVPLHTASKASKKYQTPHKSYNTTNVTRGNTISLSSFTNKKHTATNCKNSTLQSFHPGCAKTKQKSAGTSHPSASKGKAKGKADSCRKERKSRHSAKEENEVSVSKVMTNTNFYRSTRSSLDSQANFQFMSKISKIFDLVTLNSELPPQIQVFLREPISHLKSSIRGASRTQIAKNLIKFKNECSQIFKKSSSSQICVFLRFDLPQNTRWAASNQRQSFTKQENERYMREKYFQSLKKKQKIERGWQDKKIDRIENMLNCFWSRSAQTRKVYI